MTVSRARVSHPLPSRQAPERSAPAGVGRRRGQRGQGLAEFALIVPLMFILAVAVGDFGRLFNAAVATESAAREAADYGAFLGSTAWTDATAPWTTNDAEMRLRACTALSGQTDFENTAGTCTGNPVVSWRLEEADGTAPTTDCGNRIGLVAPCRVHVTVTYIFRPLIPVPPIPGSLTLVRDSWFAISDLTGS
ncbi:MAG TPA: TadE/TadG family type IV pilus assembly protein [Candidatus Limnocylindrales bacterium]|nr:TadE/TadG family type IV pilus assembly protein [Candidatus Limnocylindrales bacterium]